MSHANNFHARRQHRRPKALFEKNFFVVFFFYNDDSVRGAFSITAFAFEIFLFTPYLEVFTFPLFAYLLLKFRRFLFRPRQRDSKKLAVHWRGARLSCAEPIVHALLFIFFLGRRQFGEVTILC